MNRQIIVDKLKPIRCFLLDMDGTFYLGSSLLDGSLAFLDQVEASGRQAMFLTNNSSKSAEVYFDKLKGMGVREPFLRVLTSGQATAQYALKTFPGKRAFVLGTEMLRSELRKSGILIDDEHPDYVLIGYDTTLDYPKMTAVCDFVRDGLPYIATHPDFNCPTETGFAPDIGAIMAFIEASAGRMPDIVIGKPNRGIVDEALRITGLMPSQLAMVGDRLYTDIAMGALHGLLSILVLTGETKKEEIVNSPYQPDLVFERLSDMIKYL
ncbi:MAG TPA: HAD-IIA family hydrolase [Candidatus Limiplasma sp.]|nr:HAD-IIA family hydrolase [Candidatus Limiplasma sp.]